LAGVFGGRVRESVHLCDYPTANAALRDDTLSERMRLLRAIASLGRAARMDNKLKVRQPLAKVEVVLSTPLHQAWLEQHDELLREELNVKRVAYAREADQYITYLIQPNFKRLGPRIGKLLPAAKAALGQADGGSLLRQLTDSGKVALTVGGETIELDGEDIQVRLQAKPGWAAAQGTGCVVVLATELTPELLREGLARDLIRLIQDRRKDLGLEYTDHISVTIRTEDAETAAAVRENESLIAGETLSDRIAVDRGPLADPASVDSASGDSAGGDSAGADAELAELGDHKIRLRVAKIS
jgi:isoleucyl-tRNA synthetase